MSIVYKTLECGAFVAGDTDTCLTAYANPASQAARLARRRPYAAARQILSDEHPAQRLSPWGHSRDMLNWQRLA